MATLKEKFVNALFGTPVQTASVAPSVSWGNEKLDNYLQDDNFKQQPFVQRLMGGPDETALSLDQVKEVFTQGRNLGNADMAKAQQELGVRIPKTVEEIGLATVGQFNQPTKLSVGTSNAPRQGGFINDFVSGYEDNAKNSFKAENLAPDENKGLATKIGEGFGTLARVLDKPITRGLLVGGTALALGGNAGDALAYGLSTGVGRQNYITKDKAYRQNLINMGYTPEEIKTIPYMITDNVYNNLIRAQQLKDNAEYRNMLLANEQATKAQALKYQQMKDIEEKARKDREFNYKTKQDAIENAYKSKELEYKMNKADTKEEVKRKQSQSTLNMINKALNTVKENPEAYGFWQGVTPNDIANRADLKGAQARAVVNSVTAEYRKYLTGAQMSDKERKDYEKFLPNPRDNAQIINQKLNAMRDVISAREGLYVDEPVMNIDINAINEELKRRGQ